MIKNISFKFNLFDASNLPINDMPVNIQYYNMQENQWISVYNDVIKKGQLSIEGKATSRAKALKLFLDKLIAFEIPELRIIPEKQIFDIKKQEVLSITYEFELLQKGSLLNFDFGSAWLLDKELLKNNDRYKNFFWITSPFYLVIQKENLDKISSLEQNIVECNKRNIKLNQSNKKLELMIQDLIQKFEKLNTGNQANIILLAERKNQIENLTNELSSCRKEFEKLQKLYNTLNKDYQIQKTQSFESKKEFEKQIKDNAIKDDLLKKDLEECQVSLLQCKEKYKSFEIVWQNSKEDFRTLTNQNKVLIKEKELFNTTVFNLNNEVFTLQETIQELSKVIVIEDRPVAVKNIYKNIVQELDIANELRKNNNYSLSNLSIKLKGVINQDVNNNVGIQLFSKENANQINGNAISDISFDIVPTPRHTIESGKVPDVLGLTETAVTRVLESVGLKLNSVYQKSEKSNGASFKQTPQKGTPINPNEFVTVIFSKNE